MSKSKRERSLADNEAKAVARMLRVSPQKLNLVAQLIRGRKASAALADLQFSRKRIAVDVKKCLESAIANAENNHDLDVDDLVVSEAHVGNGIVMKRFAPRGRGERLKSAGEYDGSEDQSNRAASWHQPDVGFPLVRRQDRIRQAAARGCRNPQDPAQGAEAGGRRQDC